MSRSFASLFDRGYFFECPRWHSDRWWVTDVYASSVLSADVDGSDVRVEAVGPSALSGTGFLPDGTLLAVDTLGRRLLRRDASGELVVHADFSELGLGIANDLVVDRVGHAYVGLLGFEIGAFDLTSGSAPPPGSVVRVDPDGTAHVESGGLLMPNGMVITEDGSTLVVGETLGSRCSAFEICQDGGLGSRRIWAELTSPSGSAAPDGCSIDAEGLIWYADAFGGRCARVAEGGQVVDEVKVPDGLSVFACMLGGAGGRSLAMCCAPDFDHVRRTKAKESVVLTVEVDVPRAGCP